MPLYPATPPFNVSTSSVTCVFAAGRIVSPVQARSQLIGGMTMGLSMALHEESAMDPEFGDYPNHDLAGYHIAAHADVQDIDAACAQVLQELAPIASIADPRNTASEF